jgi:beta-carotene 3-hydroxylase
VTVAIVVASFAAMEGVSYATHRWVMHSFGMGWHRSHHAASRGRVERNDLFPVCFATVGILLFVAGATVASPFTWVGAGVTAYGAAYLAVHEIVIHRRLPVRIPNGRYLAWLRSGHAAHHFSGGEPFGMLLPFVRGSGPRSNGEDRLLDRSRIRSARARL